MNTVLLHFIGRSPRSCLPNSLTRFVDHNILIESRKSKQIELAQKKGRSAPNNFRPGDKFLIQDVLTKKWNLPGVITESRSSEDGSTRSFLIERGDGSTVIRNSRFWKHQWKSSRQYVAWKVPVSDLGDADLAPHVTDETLSSNE